jgi:O-antigen ligase
MVASFAFGGGTRGGFLFDAIIQLLALPLLLLALWRLFELPLTRQQRRAIWFASTIALLPLIQLAPLPPWLWTALPNRQPVAEAFEIVGRTLPWMPFSVSPRATWLSALSLIPPLAIFLATLLLGYRERRVISLVLLAVGITSALIGLVQVAQGPESPLRFFEITNPTEAVGFFANRNHFAALLYCVLVFAIAWTLHFALSIEQSDQDGEKSYNLNAIVATLCGFVVIVMLLSGELMARSRAGLGLTIVGLFGALALGFFKRDPRSLSLITPTKLLLGAVAVVVTFSLQFGLYRIQERFSDPLQDTRVTLVTNTIDAIRAYMPFGSGVGTFVPAYAMFEKPQDVGEFYMNHAHNDILEVWLETGIVGIGLMGLFLVWFIRRCLEVWRRAPLCGVSELDLSLMRAATIAIALVAIHSFVDYPLRTGAMMAIMAYACAMLIEPPESVRHAEARRRNTATRGARPERAKSTPVPSVAAKHVSATSAEAPSQLLTERWGVGTEWPKEWSKSAEQPGSNGEAEVVKPSKPSDH